MKRISMFPAGILIIIIGALPFLIERKIITIPFPAQGTIYNLITILLGIWVLTYSLKRGYS